MFKYHQLDKNGVAAELTDKDFKISEAQDALELINMAEDHDCRCYIVNKENLSEEFFNLGSGLAGDILQKFSNYRVKLAIVGDFSKYKSKNINDFFRESNRTGHILFVNTREEALARFGSKKS
jgi:hypothetical protein